MLLVNILFMLQLLYQIHKSHRKKRLLVEKEIYCLITNVFSNVHDT